MGILYLIRHSVTGLNSDPLNTSQEEKIRGWLDVPLSKDGIKIAKETGKILRGRKIIKLYTSDLMRANETAHIISEENNNIPVLSTPLLRPWNVGVIQGQDHDKGIEIMKYYTLKKPDVPIKGGESYNQFYDRWKEIFTHLLATANKLPNDTAIAAVTHSRNIYCVMNILTNGKAPIPFEGMINPGGVMEINIPANKIDIISNL